MDPTTMAALATILVAALGGTASVISAWVSTRQRRENLEQHGASQDVIRGLTTEVTGLRRDLSQHMSWHMEKMLNEVDGGTSPW